MNIERALNTPGWMSEAELTYIASLAEKSKLIVELGSWRGRSAVCWADNTSGVVYCVDTWADDAYGATFPGDPPDLHRRPAWLWGEFTKNTQGLGNIFPIRSFTAPAARIFADRRLKPDVLFVDAGHNYEDVIADLRAWMPLMAEGAVLCGHDYVDYHEPVQRAVRELIPSFRVVDTIWTTEGA